MQDFQHLFTIKPEDFERHALDMYRYQYHKVPIYRLFCDMLRKQPVHVQRLTEIPFLPIRFFKTHRVIEKGATEKLIFESSGTTEAIQSKHLIANPEMYQLSFLSAFRLFYGDPSSYCILGLLPSYIERGNSSLVYMVDELIRISKNPLSGFYLYDHMKLAKTIINNESKAIPTLLIGVTYALLDFFETHSIQLKSTLVMETGGMKGRRKEMTREEVHQIICSHTGHQCIHSEYGMTELLSQAYSKCNGLFNCPPWMRVVLRSEDDPFEVYDISDCSGMGKTGVVNIVDLANAHSCSFIATDDIGKLFPNGSFEIMGRLDASDIRGCSLMYSNDVYQ